MSSSASGITLADLGEFPLIAQLHRDLSRHPATPAVGVVELAIGDDAALLRLPPDSSCVVTSDALVEGVHFRRDWSKPLELGWKALAVNISDLDAMGARPVGATVTLALPPDTSPTWVRALYRGLHECGERYGCPIVGGDTVRSPSLVHLSITAFGAVPQGKAVQRSGARSGDLVCVTGVVGESAAGLAALDRLGRTAAVRRWPDLVAWHLRPEPPSPAGALLADGGLATAMLDLSDGLASDLRHLSSRSTCRITVETERLPISDGARRCAVELGLSPEGFALHGGEDYQLCFTTSPERFSEIPPLLASVGQTATIIGRVSTGRDVYLVVDEGRPERLVPGGFTHFGVAPASEPSSAAEP